MDLTLEQRAKHALQQRLKSTSNYTAAEIAQIEILERKLFPQQKINKETSDLFRRLCSLSNIHLAEPREISSHRPVIGPVIVAIKKATYPFIRAHLKGLIEALGEFCAWSVYAQAVNWRQAEGSQDL